jgi:hypothetical protein
MLEYEVFAQRLSAQGSVATTTIVMNPIVDMLSAGRKLIGTVRRGLPG